MKKIYLFIPFLVNFLSCQKKEDIEINKKINLYKINNIDTESRCLTPLLTKENFNYLINKKASFPLLSYSPNCENSCSLFPIYFNNYLKNNNVFFPFIYAINHEDNVDNQSYLYLYSDGKEINKVSLDYFKENEIDDYLNQYVEYKDVLICNDLKYASSDSEFNLATFINYKENGFNSFLNIDTFKDKEVLFINQNKINFFDASHDGIINNFKYIYYYSSINNLLLEDFNIEKKDYIYSVLKYENNSFILSEYLH